MSTNEADFFRELEGDFEDIANALEEPRLKDVRADYQQVIDETLSVELDGSDIDDLLELLGERHGWLFGVSARVSGKIIMFEQDEDADEDDHNIPHKEMTVHNLPVSLRGFDAFPRGDVNGSHDDTLWTLYLRATHRFELAPTDLFYDAAKGGQQFQDRVVLMKMDEANLDITGIMSFERARAYLSSLHPEIFLQLTEILETSEDESQAIKSLDAIRISGDLVKTEDPEEGERLLFAIETHLLANLNIEGNMPYLMDIDGPVFIRQLDEAGAPTNTVPMTFDDVMVRIDGFTGTRLVGNSDYGIGVDVFIEPQDRSNDIIRAIVPSASLKGLKSLRSMYARDFNVQPERTDD